MWHNLQPKSNVFLFVINTNFSHTPFFLESHTWNNKMIRNDGMNQRDNKNQKISSPHMG
jgi:hypothetical protein